MNLESRVGLMSLALVLGMGQARCFCFSYSRNKPGLIPLLHICCGANVHLFLCPTPADLSSVDISVMTTLKLALRRPDNFQIDWMLRRQPIRGNPHAAVPLYLHWAVALP